MTTVLGGVLGRHPFCEDSEVRDHVCAVFQSALIPGDLRVKVSLVIWVSHPGVTLMLRKALKDVLTARQVGTLVSQRSAEKRNAFRKEALENDTVKGKSGTPMTELLGEWV